MHNFRAAARSTDIRLDLLATTKLKRLVLSFADIEPGKPKAPTVICLIAGAPIQAYVINLFALCPYLPRCSVLLAMALEDVLRQ